LDFALNQEEDVTEQMTKLIDGFTKHFEIHRAKMADIVTTQILRKWINLLDIGPHPLQYELNRLRKRNDSVKTLFTNLHLFWTKEQEEYGNTESTFTYAWSPDLWVNASTDDITIRTELQNNIVILAGHHGNEQLFGQHILNSAATSNCQRVLETVNMQIANKKLQEAIDQAIIVIGSQQPSQFSPTENPKSEWENYELATLNMYTRDAGIRFSTPAHLFLFCTVQYCPRAY
jgi:hypothetical protein